jgi:hypothetical protein
LSKLMYARRRLPDTIPVGIVIVCVRPSAAVIGVVVAATGGKATS